MQNDKQKIVENSIITTYRKKIYRPFRKAIEDYELIQDSDKIAICISGGKDSMLLAKCMQEYMLHGARKIQLEFIVMDPGYSEQNRQKIEANAQMLGVPIKIFNRNIFRVVNNHCKSSPCYLCARMRRGALYEFAENLGCNKIALGHHFDDAIETMLISMFYAGEIKTMLPKIHSDNFNLQLIRPLYMVKEKDIISWVKYNELEFLDCACEFSKNTENKEASKRLEMKNLVNEFRKKSPYVELSLFNSMSNVNLNSMLGWKKDNEEHSFLDDFFKN